MATLLAIWTPGAMEIIVVLVVGLVLFGGNLPEVGKSVGRSLIEFRKGLQDLKSSAGLDEVGKVKEEMLKMAREVDPRRMMDAEDQHLPDDPYQEGEFNELDNSLPEPDPDADTRSETEESEGEESEDEESEDEGTGSEWQDPYPQIEEDDGGTGDDLAQPEGPEGPEGNNEAGRLEGGHQEPHEEDDPPTFGYKRHS